MAFRSDIANQLVIDDGNYVNHLAPTIDGDVVCRGGMPRDFDESPFGEGFARSFDLPTIPRSEWPERIEYQEKTKTRLSDLCKRVNLPCKAQGRTYYCWINAPVHCIEIARCVQGQAYIPLSPASVGAPLKGYRNQGGWGTQAIEYLSTIGPAPCTLWPANAIDRKYHTPEMLAESAKYKMSEWFDILCGKSLTFDQLATCLLLGWPVGCGYSWWRHETTTLDLVMFGKDDYGTRGRNSWGPSYGENGYFVLKGKKAHPTNALALRVAVGS